MGVLGGHMPTQIEPFHNTKSIGLEGMTSSVPSQILITSYGRRHIFYFLLSFYTKSID